MRLGIPVHNQRVSPVLDTAKTMRVYQLVDSRISESFQSVDLDQMHSGHRADKIADTDIDVLICGGLSREMAIRLQKREIQVIAWVAGKIETVVNAFCNSELTFEKFTMPGCQRRNRNCRRQRRCQSRQ